MSTLDTQAWFTLAKFALRSIPDTRFENFVQWHRRKWRILIHESSGPQVKSSDNFALTSVPMFHNNIGAMVLEYRPNYLLGVETKLKGSYCISGIRQDNKATSGINFGKYLILAWECFINHCGPNFAHVNRVVALHTHWHSISHWHRHWVLTQTTSQQVNIDSWKTNWLTSESDTGQRNTYSWVGEWKQYPYGHPLPPPHSPHRQ